MHSSRVEEVEEQRAEQVRGAGVGLVDLLRWEEEEEEEDEEEEGGGVVVQKDLGAE